MTRTPPHLLLIGGTDDDAGWVHRALAADGLTVRLERLGASEDPRPLLTSTRFDAVLVDLLASRLDAAGWLALFGEVGQRAPLVVLADARHEPDVVQWMATGASDWVFRPGFLGLSAVLARLLREAREEAAAEEEERQLREATASLLELARSPVFGGEDLTATASALTRAGSRGLKVARCSVWLYTDDRRALTLLDLFDAATGAHARGTERARKDHPRYFAALSEARLMPVTHAATDPRTAEFAAGTFAPERISSTLDVGLRVRGELVGALCLEHRGPPRRWTAAEEVYATALADVASLALESVERRRVELALAEFERRFRDLFRYSSDTIVLYRVALDGKVFCEDLNPAGERVSGVTRDQVVGKEAREVLAPLAAARLEERYAEAIRERRPISYEHELPLPSGTRVFNAAVVPLLDDAGRVHRLASIARDVTAQRNAEQLTRRLEAQLAESQKSDALTRLAAHLAHDVSSLLSAIEAHARQLKAGEASAADATFAILEATARGRELARRIATYGRRRPEEKEPVDLEPLVHEVVRQLSASARGVTVLPEVMSRPVRVLGDAAQLHQVLLNLVANALQAMPDGGRLTVRLERRALSLEAAASRPPLKAGDYVVLSVADTGRGMNEATRRRIFEPYFSTSDARTGLGLPVVQSVVTGHEGAVFVDSAPGAGTRFDVFLPALEGSEEKPGAGQHLMLVDDHAGMARISGKLLETLGYRTTVFDDPRQALDFFRQRPQAFDAVLTDLSMPQMSGEDFTRSLRSLRPNLPVIVSSGFASLVDVRELERLGVAAVLVKPWRLEEAVATLQRVLGPSPGAALPRAPKAPFPA
ncbi:MAG: response regulator [Myxococcaceae bacterium]|nr:response regulator [Myxococcaceae bacterium]